MPAPAYTRLDVDERRRQLLARGTELFAAHAYGDLSMARIAREAGISKALLYHYFPSKRAYFEATLRQAAEELAARTEPTGEGTPLEQLTGSLEAFLIWIEEHETAYRKLMEGARSEDEVRALVDEVRDRTAGRILDGMSAGEAPSGTVRAAVRSWLWFIDGACLDWLERRDYGREELRGLLLGTLVGALAAAGAPAAATGAPTGAAGS